MKIYAAYGSNMNLEQMAVRCPKAKVIGMGELQGYRLTFRGIYKGVANIEPCEERVVPIVLWSITDDCETELDKYEGYPSLYEKKEIEVIVKGKVTKAMAYVMTSPYDDKSSLPSEYYLGVIRQGYISNGLDIKHLDQAHNECIKEINV